MDDTEIRKRLTAIATSSLADAEKMIRAPDPAIRPIRPALKMVGRARTVSCADDFLGVIKALQEAAPGEVLVVDGQGGHKALAGELFATEAARKGLAGLLVDGAVRDRAGLETIDLPVYARHLHPVSGTTIQPAETQVAVSCGGIKVHPGDWVIGDADGLVVADDEELATVIPAAAAIEQVEARALAGMAAGRSLIEMLNFEAHYAARQGDEESRLAFTV